MNNVNSYPKILVLGVNFSSLAGGGVTLKNLFYNWPKEKLFMANEIIADIDKNYVDDFFILNINSSSREKKKNTKLLPRLLNVITNSQYKLELLNSKMDYYSNMDSFLQWVKIINPDVVYFMTYRIQHIKLIQEINNRTDIPIAIHIVDDWLKSRQSKICNKKILNRLDREFKRTLNTKNAFFCVSHDMSQEYKKRYKKDFYPIHNPVIKKSNTSKKTIDKSSIRIMYAGTIERYNIIGLIDLCEAIKRDDSISFNIYGNFRDKKHLKRFENYPNCFLKGTVNHEEIIELMGVHDILFLPMSFERQMKEKTKLSMPTKLTEYLNSGVVTLLYAPKTMAVTNYVDANNCAYILSENSQVKLKELINQIINNKVEREKVIENAIKLVETKHHVSMVQKQFVNILNKVVTNENN